MVLPCVRDPLGDARGALLHHVQKYSLAPVGPAAPDARDAAAAAAKAAEEEAAQKVQI